MIGRHFKTLGEQFWHFSVNCPLIPPDSLSRWEYLDKRPHTDITCPVCEMFEGTDHYQPIEFVD